MDLLVNGSALGDPVLVGHKFARQHRMREAGLPVPGFFCLAAEAFGTYTPAATGFPGAGATAQELTAWAGAARERVRAAGLPAPLAAQVLAAFDQRWGRGRGAGPDQGDGALVAVRACVAAAGDGSGEDGADDPFAGLSDSFLYVGRDDVLARIVDCWASAYNPEAVLYRVHRGVDPLAVRVAVGVQRMVPGVRSFVVFTRDPRDGTDRRVIAAAHGIGEGIVQEKADIDHFFVDGATGAIEVESAFKSVMIGLDPARPDAGPGVLAVPGALAEAPVLTDADVHRICALAAETEELFGGPQDIEGAISGDGGIFLVQARPVMASRPPAAAPTAPKADTPAALQAGAPAALKADPPATRDKQTPWTNHNLTESFPGLTSALTYSQARVFYRTGFTDFYRRLGVRGASLRANQHHLTRMIGYLDGRVYYRLDAWYALHGQIPGFELVRPMWEQSLGLTERAGLAAADPGSPWREVLPGPPHAWPGPTSPSPGGCGGSCAGGTPRWPTPARSRATAPTNWSPATAGCGPRPSTVGASPWSPATSPWSP